MWPSCCYARPGVALWACGNDAYWSRHGDEKPDSLRAGEQLTPAYLVRFNRDNPDANCVFYQSWGTRIGTVHPDGAMMLTRGLFYPAHGASDGLVTPASARWGLYRGTLDGVSHQQVVDVFEKGRAGLFREAVLYQPGARAGGKRIIGAAAIVFGYVAAFCFASNISKKHLHCPSDSVK